MVTGTTVPLRRDCRPAAASRSTRGRVGLIGQRSGGQLIPRGLHGGEVADPQVERQRRAEQHTAAPPAADAPRRHQRAPRQPSDQHRRRRRRSAAIQIHSACGAGSSARPRRGDVPVRSRGQRDPDQRGHRQPQQPPAPDRQPIASEQHDGRDGLHRHRDPAVHQRKCGCGRRLRGSPVNVTATIVDLICTA